jgi:type I restriction enzyme S subunit
MRNKIEFDMITESTNNHIPQLRFPEFQNDGEWEVKRFDESFLILPNNTLSRAELNYEKGSTKNIHYGDVLIKFGERLDVGKENLPFITDESVASKYHNAKLKNGDVVIADTAEDETVGKCTEIVRMTDETVVSGLHTISIRPQSPFAESFLGYYLNSESYRSQIRPLMQGVKVTSLSKSAINKTIILCPKSVEEQKKIAQVFSALDELISTTNDKLEQLKAYKKGLMQKLFPAKGKTLPEYRFKEFGKDGEWKVMKLGEIITEVKDTTNDSVSIPLYSLTIDEGITAKNERYERGFLVTKKDNVFKVVSPNDFVSNPMNLRLGAIGCNHNTFSVCVSGYYDVFRFKESGSSVFWINYLKSDLLLHKYDEFAIGSLIEKRRVYYSNLQNLSVLVPTIQEQRKIADCLSLLDEIINAYAEKVVQLGQYKKGLMQQMFPTSK